MKRLLSALLPLILLTGLLGACGSSDAPDLPSSPTTSRAMTAGPTPQPSTAPPVPSGIAQFPPKDSGTQAEVIVAQRPRIKPDPGETRRAELVAGVNDFAFDL